MSLVRLFSLGLVAAVLSIGLIAQERGAPTKDAPPLASAKARIVQLEEIVEVLRRQVTVCSAQLGEATQASAANTIAKRRAEVEREAGCAFDWTQAPPACKPTTSAPAAPAK